MRGATFSADRRYRYRLWRRWDGARPVVAFVMLNPSTADARPLYDVLTCIRQKTTLERAGRLLTANAERFLKPPDRMARLFADRPLREQLARRGRERVLRCYTHEHIAEQTVDAYRAALAAARTSTGATIA